MPWIDDSSPDQPKIEKKGVGEYQVTYTGNENIRGLALLVTPLAKEAKFINAQLIKVFPLQKQILLQLSQYPETQGNRAFVVTIDRGNNVSPLTELK
jgi:hypothetical protein